MEQTLFLNKYQPVYFKDFVSDDGIIDILNTLIKMDKLNILFIGDVGSGKTTFLNAVIKEYYKNVSHYQYKDNILHNVNDVWLLNSKVSSLLESYKTTMHYFHPSDIFDISLIYPIIQPISSKVKNPIEKRQIVSGSSINKLSGDSTS